MLVHRLAHRTDRLRGMLLAPLLGPASPFLRRALTAAYAPGRDQSLDASAERISTSAGFREPDVLGTGVTAWRCVFSFHRAAASTRLTDCPLELKTLVFDLLDSCASLRPAIRAIRTFE